MNLAGLLGKTYGIKFVKPFENCKVLNVTLHEGLQFSSHFSTILSACKVSDVKPSLQGN